MRIVFMGTPEFSVPTLQMLLNGPHEVVAVYTQPPRPAGRGQKVKLSPVHQRAEAAGIPVETPLKLRTEESLQQLKSYRPDLIVVIAYGMILPQAALDIPPLGCINIHASLLPRWRGAAPIHHAILAGDAETGVCIMKMEAGLDTGPVYRHAALPITATMTGGELHDAMALLGANEMGLFLEDVAAGKYPPPQTQPEEGVTYASKITDQDALIQWDRSAIHIDRQVRALTPWPGAYFLHQDIRFKILRASPVTLEHKEAPGTLLNDQLLVACGDGALQIEELQKPGGRPLKTIDFLNGFPLKKGTSL